MNLTNLKKNITYMGERVSEHIGRNGRLHGWYIKLLAEQATGFLADHEPNHVYRLESFEYNTDDWVKVDMVTVNQYYNKWRVEEVLIECDVHVMKIGFGSNLEVIEALYNG